MIDPRQLNCVFLISPKMPQILPSDTRFGNTKFYPATDIKFGNIRLSLATSHQILSSDTKFANATPNSISGNPFRQRQILSCDIKFGKTEFVNIKFYSLTLNLTAQKLHKNESYNFKSK